MKDKDNEVKMVSVREYARANSLSEPGARKRVMECQIELVNGKFDANALARALEERQKQQAGGAQLTRARAFREQLKAKREQRQFEVEEGNLISLEDLAETIQQAGAHFRNAMLPLPLEVAEQWQRMTPSEIVRAYDQHIRTALNHIDMDVIFDSIARARERAEA